MVVDSSDEIFVRFVLASLVLPRLSAHNSDGFAHPVVDNLHVRGVLEAD